MHDLEVSTAPGAESRRAKRVLLVCQLDRVSNGVKPVEIERFLTARGHDVHLLNTYSLGRASSTRGSIWNKLPALHPKRFAIYVLELLSALARQSKTARRLLTYYTLVGDVLLRRSFLTSNVDFDDFDLVVNETPHDAGVLTVPTRARTLYDCPTPWADELYNDGKLTRRQHARLREFEREIYERVDYMAFWWPSYAQHALDHYGISGANLITLNYGCTPSPERAEFRRPPRIVYIGALDGAAINLPLLSRVTALYPHIDVYGEPAPDPALGLNYLGWAPPTILRDYQIGLITSSDDELRRNGFSAKHPHYLAYGLPVLVPSWRRNQDRLQGSVAYDESTFLSCVERLSDESEWRRTSDRAYAQAQKLAWDVTLQPLDDILRGREPRRFDGAGDVLGWRRAEDALPGSNT